MEPLVCPQPWRGHLFLFYTSALVPQSIHAYEFSYFLAFLNNFTLNGEMQLDRILIVKWIDVPS